MGDFRSKAMQAAESYMRRGGCKVIDRAYRTRDGGQIDLVAEDGDQLVFVEVRARRSAGRGFPSASKGGHALREMAAIEWLQDAGAGFSGRPMRFDDISLVAMGADRALIRHLLGVPHGEPRTCEQRETARREEPGCAAA